MECPTSRIIVTVPGEPGWDTLFANIEEVGSELGPTQFLHSLETRLFETHAAGVAANAAYKYGLFKIPFGNDFAFQRLVAERLGDRNQRLPILAVEPDYPVPLSAPMGLGFQRGGNDQDYRDMMGVDAAHGASPPVKGAGRRVAIIDSGCEAAQSSKINGFWDLTQEPLVSGKPSNDTHGHGSAMLELAQSVAPDAEFFSIRVCEDNSDPSLFDILAALYIAAVDAEANIISMSLGFSDIERQCMACGGTVLSQSYAFRRVSEGVAYHQNPSKPKPILLAATGNKGRTDHIDSPADFDRVVSIGSVDSTGQLSDFTNYKRGDQQFRHFVLPGGQANPDGRNNPAGANLREHVGVTAQAGSECFGTSPATAYAAGLLALLWSDPRYSGLQRDKFLDAIEANHCKISNGYRQDAYGSGQVFWSPLKRRSLVGGTKPGGKNTTVGFEDDVVVFGDYVIPRGSGS